MSELVGPLVGILIAFGLERSYSGNKDRKHRKELKINLREELKKCQELLSGIGNLLPIAMWNSAISSGDIGLLSFTDRTKLSSLYFEIDNYNYEAKRLRDVAVIVNSSHRDDAQNYWKGLTVSMMNTDQLLKAKIVKMLEEQLWNNNSKANK
jgi:hypothetical protein